MGTKYEDAHSDFKLVATYDKNAATSTGKSGTASSPKTGDTSNLFMPIVFISVAAVSLVAVLYVLIKKKNRTQ